VAYRGGGVQTPPKKFRSFNKAEPNSQSHGKYIRNNLTRIRLSLIFRVVSWKALPTSYDSHSSIFFLKGMMWHKNKVPKIKKMLPYEMKFLVLNYSCLQNSWLRGYRPHIPILSVRCPQLNLLNPPEKNSWVHHWMTLMPFCMGIWKSFVCFNILKSIYFPGWRRSLAAMLCSWVFNFRIQVVILMVTV
jgi:hypothetical protein